MTHGQTPDTDSAIVRAGMYELLAAGFLHPDQGLAAAIAYGSFAADAVGTTEALLASAQSLPVPTEASAEGTEALYHALAVEYARLFIGAPAAAVWPYESVQVDAGPDSSPVLMVSPSARAVLAAYREAGLNMVEGLNEPPDHIATEFEFMHYLCVKEALAGETRESDEAQEWHSIRSRFLREHLAVWGIDFAHKVAASTTNGFYRAIANIAAALLRLEVESDAASPVPSSARA